MSCEYVEFGPSPLAGRRLMGADSSLSNARRQTHYAVRCAGERAHEELWVPSAELGEFEAHIGGLAQLWS